MRTIAQHDEPARMLYDRAPVERTRVVEPIVTVEHGLDAFALTAWLEKFNGVSARRAHVPRYSNL
jgi:hypothetical protein